MSGEETYPFAQPTVVTAPTGGSGPGMLGMIFFCVNTKIVCFHVFAELTCIHEQRSSGQRRQAETPNGEPKMNNAIANLETRLLDIPGDMCETKARYIENSKAFIATLTDDEAAIRKGLNRLVGAEMIADIREEGAGAWEFWASEGMLSGIRNRDLAALKA